MDAVLNLKEKILLRNTYNQCIITLLKIFLNENPELRFGQALVILGICEDIGNVFNEESVDTYNKVLFSLEKQTKAR